MYGYSLLQFLLPVFTCKFTKVLFSRLKHAVTECLITKEERF